MAQTPPSAAQGPNIRAEEPASNCWLRFSGIFDQLADGFLSLDSEWRFAYVNPAACKALGIASDLLGQVFWDSYPDARETIFELEFRRALSEGVTTEFEAFYPALGVWLRVNAFPLDRGIGVSFADITQARQAQQQLRKLNKQLEEQVCAYREVESFAHTVAHDLRSPLGAILGFSQALSECAVNELGPRSAHYLRRIQNAARDMDEMTEAILTLCRLSRPDMKWSVVDLSQVARECIATLVDADPGRKVKWSVASCMWADCDPGLIKLVLQNLLSNAWKYTRARSRPYVGTGIVLGPDNQMCYFVRDNGIGFIQAEEKSVFEPFRRLNEHGFQGEGIGLATVKRIIDRHGGSVWAESAPGKGATFFFTLGPAPARDAQV